MIRPMSEYGRWSTTHSKPGTGGPGNERVASAATIEHAGTVCRPHGRQILCGRSWRRLRRHARSPEPFF